MIVWTQAGGGAEVTFIRTIYIFIWTEKSYINKGPVSGNLLLHVFPGTPVYYFLFSRCHFDFHPNFAKRFATHEAPPVSTTLVINRKMFKQKVSRARFSQSVADTDERVHRQWPVSCVQSIMMVNSVQPGEGGMAHARLFTLSTITSKVVVYAPAEKADTPHISPLLNSTLWSLIPVVRWVANIPSWNFEKSTTRDTVPLMASRMIV